MSCRATTPALVVAMTIAPVHVTFAQARSSAHAVSEVPVALAAPLNRPARTLIGVVAGAVVGGAAAYLIVKSGCARCDDNAPMLLGAALGAIGGAVVGVSIANQHARGAPFAAGRSGAGVPPARVVVWVRL